MREIKFRIFNTRNKKIITNNVCFQLALGVDGIIKAGISDDVLMQFTGLKDKNGKDIYEGDIVTRKETACNSSYISKYKVGYKENAFILEVLQSHILKKGAILYRMEDCEIVGNIYENQELLK